ncbi:hypothetical protein VTI74DRAFT_355 [Chaetomium olivicolor]
MPPNWVKGCRLLPDPCPDLHPLPLNDHIPGCCCAEGGPCGRNTSRRRAAVDVLMCVIGLPAGPQHIGSRNICAVEDITCSKSWTGAAARLEVSRPLPHNDCGWWIIVD